MSIHRKLALALIALPLAAPGCGWFGIGSPPNSAEPKSSAAEETPSDSDGEDDQAKPADEDTEASNDNEEVASVDLEKELTPPDGMVDLRLIFGTDSENPLPAIFGSATSETTVSELDGIFPGVGSDKRMLELAGFTRKGDDDRWSKVLHRAAHNGLLRIALDGDGIHSLSYTTASQDWVDGTWEYAKKAAFARWGTPDQGKNTTGFVLTFELEGMTVSVQGGSPGSKSVSVRAKFKD